MSWSTLHLSAQTWQLNADDLKNLAAERVVLHKKSSQGQKVQHVDAFLLIQAPMQQVFELITDFSQLPDYAPHVEHINIIQQNSRKALVGYTLGLPLGVIKRYRLRLDFSHDKHSRRMAWHSSPWQAPQSSQRIGETSGYWFLQQTANPNITWLAYQTITDPGDVPFGLGWIVDYLSHTSITELLMQTKLRAEAQWQAAPPRRLQAELTSR